MYLHLLGLLLLLVSLSDGDQRCLLEGGGSTDTFFVREDSRAGEEVGRLRVTGQSVSNTTNFLSRLKH